MSEPLTAEEALRQIREWCDDSRDEIVRKHASEQRLLFAVIPALCDATLDAARDRPGLDVERLARALHAGDCVPNGLGLHEAGSPDAYCTLIAPAVAREYDRG